ncbi:MAG: hypothetical protein ACLRP3_08420 [Escherichia sp.]
MAEESLPFYTLLVPVMMAARFDPLVAAATVLWDRALARWAQPLTHFATVIAANAAGSLYSGHFAACYFAVSRLRDLCLLGYALCPQSSTVRKALSWRIRWLKTRRIFWEIVQKRCWNLPPRAKRS